ncbi:MAG: S8 family serine peptidase [Candidatus Anstonellales archaeon]
MSFKGLAFLYFIFFLLQILLAGPLLLNENLREEKIDATVLEKLNGEGSIRVIVLLNDSEPVSEIIGQYGLYSPNVVQKQREYSLAQEKVISSLRSFPLKARYKYFNAFAGEVTRQQLLELERNPLVKRIIYDRPVYISLQEALPLQNVTPAYNLYVGGQNITGKGQAVCVIDTGIAYNHESFGNCTSGEFFSGNCSKVRGGWNFVNRTNDPTDDNGHGSHVAGIIAANGSVRGVAPEAEIVALKVLNRNGQGYFSDVALAVEWCISNKSIYNISVISMSLGDGGRYTEDTCPTFNTSLFSSATNAGIAIFAASGNENHSTGISHPACDPSVISVGAVYDADVGGVAWSNCVDATTSPDRLTCFTNRGPNLDLLAAGALITSVDYDGTTVTMGGTSMAAPMAAGAAALIKQFISLQRGNATPIEIKNTLKASGKNVTDPWNGTVYPRISVFEALIRADSIKPTIFFVEPTPANNVTINGSNVFINISINENYSSAIIEWAGSNESLINSTNTKSFYAYINKTNLSSGTYPYKIYVIDLNGNINSSETRNIIVDNYPIFDFSSPTPDDNSVINKTWVEINVTFSSPSASVVLLEWNLSSNLTMNGTFPTFGTTISSLSDENYTYRVYANSSGTGLWNVSETRRLRIDTIAPVISFVDRTPLNNSYSQNSSFIINITSSETLERVSLYFNGTEYNMTNNTGTGWYYNITVLFDGNYTYYVVGHDFGGNSNTTGTNILYVQMSDMNITFLAPTPQNASNVSANSVVINFTISGFSDKILLEWNYSINETVNSNNGYYWINKSDLGEGEYSYRVLANHSARNQWVSSEERKVHIDLTKPRGLFVSPTPSDGHYQNLTYVFINLSVNEPIKNATLEWNGTNYTMNGVGTLWYINLTNLIDGEYSYSAYMTDYADNTNKTATNSVHVDTLPPNIRLLYIWNITNESTTIALVSSEPVNATVLYGFSQNALLNTSNDTAQTTTKNITLSSLVPSSMYYVQVKISDLASNHLLSSIYRFVTTKINRLNITENSSYQLNSTETNLSIILVTNATIVEGEINISFSSLSANNLNTSNIYEKGLDIFVFITTSDNVINSLLDSQLRISYNQTEVDSLGISEATLRPFKYNTINSSWIKYEEPVAGVDVNNNYVWINTTSYSEWTIGGKVQNGYSCLYNQTCVSGFCSQNTYLCENAPSSSSSSGSGGGGGGSSIGGSSAGSPSASGGSGASFISQNISSGLKTYYFRRSTSVDAFNNITHFSLFIQNNDTEPIENFEVVEVIPSLAADSKEKVYFDILPDVIENGSIIAKWKFLTLSPQESIEIKYSILGKVYKTRDFASKIILLSNDQNKTINETLLLHAPALAALNEKITLFVSKSNGSPAPDATIVVVSPLRRAEYLTTDNSGMVQYMPTYPGVYTFYSPGVKNAKPVNVTVFKVPEPEMSRLQTQSLNKSRDKARTVEIKETNKPSIFSSHLELLYYLAGGALIIIGTSYILYVIIIRKIRRRSK